MSLDYTKSPFLFSAGTHLAYKIAKNYYGDTHYVWCTTKYHSNKQPVTSDPQTICKRYLEQIVTGDRHSVEITNNIAGILKGAKVKCDSGVITAAQYNDIAKIVSVAMYEAFTPVLFIIDSKKVANRCQEVMQKDRANDHSIEYIITDLKHDEFEVILFKDLLNGIIDITDMKAGD